MDEEGQKYKVAYCYCVLPMVHLLSFSRARFSALFQIAFVTYSAMSVTLVFALCFGFDLFVSHLAFSFPSLIGLLQALSETVLGTIVMMMMMILIKK